MTTGNVVTKSGDTDRFGNDKSEDQSVIDQSVVTKTIPGQTFGNDTAMFVRVRKRETLYGTSASYDLVHAVRIKGKPRQKFLLGLGSLKTPLHRYGQYGLVWFWHRALNRMRRHGLNETKRKTIIESMVRKGAAKPTLKQCQDHIDSWTHIHFDFSDFYPGCVSKISEEEADLQFKAELAKWGISLPGNFGSGRNV